MNLLRIENDYSYLMTDDSGLRDKLWSSLRFKTRDYFHSPLYRQKLWDGYIDFLSRKTGRFLTGLLPEVRLALEYLRADYKVADNRQITPFLFEKVDSQFLNQFLQPGQKPITLDAGQIDLINQGLTYKRGIVKAPTGAGKTYILLALIKSLPPGTPILFLANRKMVLDRNYDEMKEWGVENLGYLDGNIHEPNLITFALVQSIHRLAPVLPKFRALFVDEVHMMMGDQCIDTYKKLKACGVRICMSATPFKYQLKKRNSKEAIEGDKVHKYSVKGYFGAEFKTDSTETGDLRVEYLQGQGRLSPSKCTYHYIDYPQIPFDIYIDAVTNGIAKNWEFHQIVTRLSQSLTGRTLILVERLSHGDALHKLIPGSLWVQGKDNKKTRTHVVQQLQEAKGNVIAIATVGIFNAAVNVFVHNLINAAGGKAEHDIIQRIGRGLRTADDKDILNFYDFIFRINTYLEDHSRKRIRILREEGHEVIIKDNIDF